MNQKVGTMRFVERHSHNNQLPLPRQFKEHQLREQRRDSNPISNPTKMKNLSNERQKHNGLLVETSGLF